MLPPYTQTKHDFDLLAGLPPLQITITAVEAFIIMSQLQLASRHPANTGPSANIAHRFARTLQQAVCLTPNLQAVAEAGWNPAFDVPTEPDRSA